MRVKKDANVKNKATTSLVLNTDANSLPTDSVKDSDGGTPLIFDPDEFNPEMDGFDMLMYGANPYFQQSLFPNFAQQTPYVDPELYQEFLESLNNPLVSPEIPNEEDSLSETKETKVTESPENPGAEKTGISTQLLPNLSNYSLTVKVRHPEKVASNKISTEKNMQDGVDKNTTISEANLQMDSGNVSSGVPLLNQSVVPNTKLSLDDEKRDHQNITNFERSEVSIKKEPAENVSNMYTTQIPIGSFIMKDGTVLIPAVLDSLTNNVVNNNNTIVTAAQHSQQVNPEMKVFTENLKDLSTISNIQIQSQGNSNHLNTIEPAVDNQLLLVANDQSQVSNKGINNHIQATTESNANQIIHDILEPASPTATPNNSQTANRLMKFPPTVIEKPVIQRIHPVVSKVQKMPIEPKPTSNTNFTNVNNNKRKNISKIIDDKNRNTKINSDVEYTQLSSNRKKPKLTSVDIITDIVGSSTNNALDDDKLLKEAVSRPIKHRADAETATIERSVKNAVNARVNRQKHKLYVQTLKDANDQLEKEMDDLRHQNDILTQEKDLLNKEVIYLKRVIANQSSLSKVLHHLNDIKDVQLSSSFSLNNQIERPSTERVRTTGGVCIHVTGEKASLELCQKCAAMASQSAS